MLEHLPQGQVALRDLGVAKVVFFRADRSERAPRYTEKWDRIAVEACKQCGRAWLPEFNVSENLEAALLDHALGQILIAA